MTQISFSIPEILSLFGVMQCVYVLVYMAFRAGEARRAALPFLYFSVLGVAFFLDFAVRFIGVLIQHYDILQWFFWFSGPPVSVLLILQIARIRQTPPLKSFWVLLLPFLALAAGMFMAQRDESCRFPDDCPVLQEWLVITGLLAGAAGMAALWGHRRLIEGFAHEKGGKERYWLILTLIFTNLFFLGLMLAELTAGMGAENVLLTRTILGLALVYLAGTSLFRIYPQSLSLLPRGKSGEPADMSAEDRVLAARIESLLDIEKVYHEPAYGRADLARELETPETVISRVINGHFGKSFPQLLNERRVEDAKRLLRETDAPVKIIAREAGFNSGASFNRVFRDVTGATPSAYRSQYRGSL